MGLVPGFVTGVPGIPRTRQLKIIGNGVVPQQAAAALRLLIGAAAVPAVPDGGTRAARDGRRLSARRARVTGASRRYRGGSDRAVPACRRPPGPHPRRRDEKERRACARPVTPSPGIAAQVHLRGQRREPGVGTDRPPRLRRPRRGRRRPRRGARVRAARRARRRPGRGPSPPTVPAAQVPARDADQRPGHDAPHLHPRRRCAGPVRRRGLDVAPARPRRRPAGRARQEQGGELAASPGLGGGDPQPRAARRDRRPGQGQHVHVLIPHVTVRDPPPLGTPALQGTAVMTHLLLSNWQSAGPAREPAATIDARLPARPGQATAPPRLRSRPPGQA